MTSTTKLLCHFNRILSCRAPLIEGPKVCSDNSGPLFERVAMRIYGKTKFISPINEEPGTKNLGTGHLKINGLPSVSSYICEEKTHSQGENTSIIYLNKTNTL